MKKALKEIIILHMQEQRRICQASSVHFILKKCKHAKYNIRPWI